MTVKVAHFKQKNSIGAVISKQLCQLTDINFKAEFLSKISRKKITINLIWNNEMKGNWKNEKNVFVFRIVSNDLCFADV